MNPTDILRPSPVHETPDTGPVHRGGGGVMLLSLLGVLVTVALCSLLREHLFYVWLPVIFLGIPSLWGWWCVWRVLSDKSIKPRSHSLLAGTLGFDIVCTSKKVAVAAFFFQDKVQAGDETKLLIFLENYASRQRVVRVKISRHPGLGLAEKQTLRLHLAAGQAAVYEMPVRVSTDITTGAHSLPVVIESSAPNGHGRRLPGARRHLYDIRWFRYAVPFDVEPNAAPSPAPQTLPSPAYRTLASVDEPSPKLDVLQSLCPNNETVTRT